jgi:hypothetical protein
MLHGPTRCAEDPCLSFTYTFTGASVCRRLILMISATIRLGTQQDQATAWYASVSPIPKTPIYSPSNTRSIGAAKIRA